MQKVRLTEEGFTGVKRTNNGIYNMYTTEEVLSMDNVSEKEKKAIKMVLALKGVIGWVEDVNSTKDDKIFLQIYDEDILEYIDQI